MKADAQQARNGESSPPYGNAHQNPTPEGHMKVKLLTRKGATAAGSVVEYDDVSAGWLIEKGHAEAVTDKSGGNDGNEATDKPARRGRPRKDES